MVDSPALYKGPKSHSIEFKLEIHTSMALNLLLATSKDKMNTHEILLAFHITV